MVNLVHVADMYGKARGIGFDADGRHQIRPQALEGDPFGGQYFNRIFGKLPDEIGRPRVLLTT